MSVGIGVRPGYVLYEPDSIGLFGHVGLSAGVAAVAIGCFLIWIALHEPTGPLGKVMVGVLTVVLGHLGVIAGALLFGTAGVLLGHVAGIWLFVRGVRSWHLRRI